MTPNEQEYTEIEITNKRKRTYTDNDMLAEMFLDMLVPIYQK